MRIARWRERDSVDARIRVDVRGDPSSGRKVSFTVTAGGASAQRTLDDAPEDCDQLHSAVALAIALSIDATLMDPRAQREATLPVPEVAKPPAPEPRLLPQLEPHESEGGREPMHLLLAVLAGPSVRVLRATTLAFSPRLSLLPTPWLTLSVAGYATGASGLRVGSAPGTVSSSLLAGGLDACLGGKPTDRFDVHGCLGARLGGLHHAGHGFTPNFHDSQPWFAVAVGTQLEAWVSESVAIGVTIDALIPVAKYTLEVEGLLGARTETSTLPPFGLSVALGPVFRFF